MFFREQKLRLETPPKSPDEIRIEKEEASRKVFAEKWQGIIREQTLLFYQALWPNRAQEETELQLDAITYNLWKQLTDPFGENPETKLSDNDITETTIIEATKGRLNKIHHSILYRESGVDDVALSN